MIEAVLSVLVLVLLLFAYFGRDRCGFLGLGTTMCAFDTLEICSFFPLPSHYGDYVLGDCPTGPSAVANCTSSATEYNICLDIEQGVPMLDHRFFTAAATRWERAVVGELADINSSAILDMFPDTGLPYEGCTYPEIIDDLYICGRYAPVDDRDGVLASAGPTFWRLPSFLPITGRITIDSADIASLKDGDYLGNVILHEMGHVLGIGTLWQISGLAGIVNGTCSFTGTNANLEYENLTGCPIVPLDNTESVGTACKHWDEACLQDELMTGFLFSSNLPLSRITIASLLDMGYEVDFSAADNFTKQSLGLCPLCSDRRWTQDTAYIGTRQLGGIPSSRQQLSESMRQYAIDYGQSILDREASLLGPRSDFERDGIEFAGSTVIAVVVKDGDAVFSVVVVATRP